MNLFICSGLDPHVYFDNKPKLNIVLIGCFMASLLLHMAVRLRIVIYKLNTKPGQQPTVSCLLQKFVTNFENQSLSDFTMNVAMVILLGFGVTFLIAFNNVKPSELNVYPNYYFIYFLHIYAPLTFGGFITFFIYFRHKPLQIFISKEMKVLLERYLHL